MSLLALSPEIQRPTLPDPPPASVPAALESPAPQPEPTVPEPEPEPVPEPEPTQAGADPEPAPAEAASAEPAPAELAPAEPAPAELAPTEPLPPADVLPSPADFELPTPAAPHRFQPPTPRYRGTGMLIAAGILGATATGLKIWSSALVLRSLRQPDEWGWSVDALIYPSFFYNPLYGLSLGLLGGGMGMRGQWRAHVDAFGGDAPRLRFPVRPGLGWGLFGAGVGAWAITRAIGWVSPGMNAVQRAAFLELTYYGSLGLSTSGMALGAFGSGYRRIQRMFGIEVALAPSFGPDQAGLSISGRF